MIAMSQYTLMLVIVGMLITSLLVAFLGEREWVLTRICTAFFTLFMTLTVFGLMVFSFWPTIRLVLDYRP